MPWLTDGVFRHGDTECLTAFPEVASPPRPARFVHFLNPFRSPTGHSNGRVRAISHESISRTREFAAKIPANPAAVVTPAFPDLPRADT